LRSPERHSCGSPRRPTHGRANAFHDESGTHDGIKRFSPKPREEHEMQGKKTHEQQLRILENKEDVPDPRRPAGDAEPAHVAARSKRQSEFGVSRGGMNQESSDNKHNHGGQRGHKPQQHTSAEEKSTER